MSRVEKLLRNKTLIRDGHRFVNCASRDNLTIDHIVEVRDGGRDKLKNLQTLCRNCHNKKNGFYTRLETISDRNISISNLAMSAMRYGIAKNYEEAIKLVHQI